MDPTLLSRLPLHNSVSCGSQTPRSLLLRFHVQDRFYRHLAGTSTRSPTTKDTSGVKISSTVGFPSTSDTISSRDISKRFSGTGAVSDKTTPFCLGKDSLIRAAVVPKVKVPATLLLVEHLLLGSGLSPTGALGLFLFDFLRDGHLLCHWVRSANSGSAITDSRYKI